MKIQQETPRKWETAFKLRSKTLRSNYSKEQVNSRQPASLSSSETRRSKSSNRSWRDISSTSQSWNPKSRVLKIPSWTANSQELSRRPNSGKKLKDSWRRLITSKSSTEKNSRIWRPRWQSKRKKSSSSKPKNLTSKSRMSRNKLRRISTTRFPSTRSRLPLLRRSSEFPGQASRPKENLSRASGWRWKKITRNRSLS